MRGGFSEARATTVRSLVALVLIVHCIAYGQQKPPASVADSESAKLAAVHSMIDRQQWAEAGVGLRAYLAEHPRSSAAHALLAEVLFQSDQPEDSIQEFLEAAAQRKLRAGELKTLGLAYATTGSMEDARKSLVESLALDARDAGALEALGHVQVEMGRYEEAVKTFQRLLMVAPKTAFAATEIGLASERLARFDDAAKAFRDAIAWQGSGASPDPVPFAGLGRILIKQNKAKEALAPLRRALELGADESGVHEQLGEAYLALGQLDPARAELERATKLDPSVARIHLALGQVYQRIGRKDEAAEQMQLYTNQLESRGAKQAGPPGEPHQ